MKDTNGNYKAINGTSIIPFAIKDLQKVIEYSIKTDSLYSKMKKKIFEPIINDANDNGYIWYKSIVENSINSLDYNNEITSKEIVSFKYK